MLGRLGPFATTGVVASALVLFATLALAQDALRGKRLYLDTTRLTGSPVMCVDCHGGLPRGLFGIGRAANDADAVARAVASIPQMTPLRGHARIAGPDAGDYLIAADGCIAGKLLGTGHGCEILVVFRPEAGASGLRTAALQVDHEWVGATVAVALLGTAE